MDLCMHACPRVSSLKILTKYSYLDREVDFLYIFLDTFTFVFYIFILFGMKDYANLFTFAFLSYLVLQQTELSLVIKNATLFTYSNKVYYKYKPSINHVC